MDNTGCRCHSYNPTNCSIQGFCAEHINTWIESCCGIGGHFYVLLSAPAGHGETETVKLNCPELVGSADSAWKSPTPTVIQEARTLV